MVRTTLIVTPPRIWIDSYNGVSRLINPAAFGIGIYGNEPRKNARLRPSADTELTRRSTPAQLGLH
jgi:hypothetical protein